MRYARTNVAGKRIVDRTSALALAAVAGCMGLGASQALGQTWTGGGGDYSWNTKANWNNNAVPGTGSNVVFNSAVANPIGLTANAGFNNINFTSGATGNYTIGDVGETSILTANGNAAIDIAANIGLNSVITINAPIAYNGGSGRFTINGGNTASFVFNGDLTLTPSTWHNLNAANGSTNYINGAITKVAGSGDLSVGAGTWVFSNANPNLLARVTVGSTLKITNANALQNAPVYVTGTLDLSGLAATVGSLTVRSGNVGIVGDTLSSINSQGTVTLQGGTVNTALVGSAAVVKTNVAGDPQMNFVSTLAGVNTYTGVTTITGGTLKLDANAGGSLASGAAVTIGGDTANFQYAGKNATASEQTLGAITVNNEGYLSGINATGGTGGGTAKLNLATITATTPGTALQLTTGTGGTITTSQTNTNGILSGRILLNSNDFASGNGAGNAITAAAYTAIASSGSDTNNSLLSAGAGTTTQSGNLTTNSLKFASTGARVLDLGGNALKLTSGGLLVTGSVDTTSITNGTITAGTSDLVVHATRGLTISAAIADNGGNASSLTKSGSNTLTLSGANTYTGNTYVNQGALTYGAGDVLPNTTQLMVTTGSIVNMGAYNDTIDQLILSRGTINGTGTLTTSSDSLVQNGTIYPVLAGSAGLTKTGVYGVTLNNANTYAGLTTVTEGTLTYGINNATGGGDLLVNGGTLDLKSFSGNVGQVTLTSGNITSTGSAGVLTSNDGFDVESGNLSVKLAGIGGLTKTTTGTLSITGANMQTGTTVVNQGTVSVGAGAQLAAATTALQFSNNNTGAGNTAQINFANQVALYQVGSLSGTIATPLSGTNNAYINLATAAGLSITQTTDGTFAGAIRQNGGNGGNLTLSAASTAKLTLTSASHNYNGGTTVLGGVLSIASGGNINSTSGITVNGGEFNYNSATALTRPITMTSGTVSGAGIIKTALSIGANATIAPGNSRGTLTVNNAAHTWDGGGTYAWQLLDNNGTAGTGWDLISVTGTGTLNVAATNVSPFTIALETLSSIAPDVAGTSQNWNGTVDHSWLIAQSATDITNFDASDFVIDSSQFSGVWLQSEFSVSISPNNREIYLNYTAVPEPASLGVLALGGLGLLARRRRK